MKQESLMLFGSSQAVSAEVQKAVTIKPRYVYNRIKRGKKWVVERDIANNPVMSLDGQGQPIVAARRIALLPRTSKDGPNLKDITGLSGQGLFAFERTVRDGMLDSALAELLRLRANGQYTFGAEIRNEKSGTITLVCKPTLGASNVHTSADEVLQKELERRGFTVVKETAKDAGEQTELPAAPEPPAAPTTKPKGNAKGKGKA